MVLTVISILVAFGGGFACGRVKNAKKLAAVKVGLDAVEDKVGAEAKTLIALVRQHL
jgi:hypothetical protein